MPSPKADPPSDAQAFYGNLADGYDRMVDFDRRVTVADHFVQRLRQRFLHTPPTVAVDLGCGTGAYTLALAHAAQHTIGVDLSPEMLLQARAHADHRNSQAVFKNAPLQHLPAALPWGRADLVLCLGNTLPHLTDPADLQQTFSDLKRLLAGHGICVIQTLNYDRILQQRERIVSIDRHHNQEFIRFYDFLDSGLIRFNILRIEWRNGQAQTAPIDSLLLQPYTRQELQDMANAAGLRVRCQAGDLNLAPFDPDQSETVLLVLEHARR